MYLTDIAHHHLAIGITFIHTGHLYSSFRAALGTYIRDTLYTSTKPHSIKSLHLALSLILASCTALTSTTTQHIYSLTPYFYLSYDHIYFTALYVHHSYITSLLTIGSHAHTAITLVRDWITPLELESSSKQIRIHTHKAAIMAWFSHTSSILSSLGLHITVLIRGSKLMPDKMEHSFGFSCDGPGRGGTCDISAWDSFYLATCFYFHY